MNRGILVLVCVIGLGAGAALLARHYLQAPPSAWLCHEYGLTPGQAERMKVL